MDQLGLNFKAAPKSEPKTEEPPTEKASGAPNEAAPKIFTVGALMGHVRGAVEGNFRNVWVTGEVSNLRMSPSGHTYFSLKDEKALLKTALFKGYAAKIKFQIKDGVELIVHGNLSVYEKGSDLNLIADHCEPKGVGALQLAFEQLKEKLFKEGLFAPDKKKPLPFLPKKIGIVTSPTGAAVRDILNILGRRYPGMDILLYPVRVQGDGSAAEVAEAIRYFNTRDDIDVMIVGRGGGSLEDLWAFNEEVVARAVFASKIPVISAVGHEIDFTICDFVADKRAPTPSAAAEIVVPKKEDLARIIGERRAQLVRALSVCADMKKKRFEQIRSHLRPPTARFPDLLMQIDSLEQRLRVGVQGIVERLGARAGQLAAELSHLSPLTILAKGYSVVYKGERVVKSVKDVKQGDDVRIRMSEGHVEATVK